MFEKILIANRGEIALRIARSAHQLGIRTVAIFSDADAHAPHTQFTDEAVHIGPSQAAQSYLSIEKIIQAAKQTNAQAIHPGYGFLSENADFAAACAAAGLCFVGPSADVIRTMGSKRDAKTLMAEHGVPVVPGYFGDVSDRDLAREAEKIGFPVLIKASAGGGGRGMRLVNNSTEFDPNLQSARREALGAFGDDTVLLEKYIERPRHIEVQIFGDTHGNVVHLFERDCSVQRRYQKLIEEAPATGLKDTQRKTIHDSAVLAGNAAGYVGAGTVEFVVDARGEVYFIEMNTRLQVEHPVTEMITGEDLVAWQFRVAAGEALPDQATINARGHSIELRLCAEDPMNSFAPSTGLITHLSLPESNIRVDHGIAEGLTISPFYDSMIAKLIVQGDDRPAVLRRAIQALEQTEVAGIATNAAFLKQILRHDAFAAGAVDTHFIEQYHSDLLPAVTTAPITVLATAALAIVGNRESASSNCDEPHSPWNATHPFRINLNHTETLTFVDSGQDRVINIEYIGNTYQLEVAGEHVSGTLESVSGAEVVVRLDGIRRHARVIVGASDTTVFFQGDRYTLHLVEPFAVDGETQQAGSGLAAPMPGTVLEVFAKVGQELAAGDPIMLIEAMKIEHTIKAPYDGVVKELRFKAGDQIGSEGIALAVMEAKA
jgi:3-methylcrotonyl-CoA carboxylase alpha subunit